MEFLSALKSELLRPLVVLVVPGCIAVAPLVLIAEHYFLEMSGFWSQHPNTFTAIVLITVLTAGLILEDVGASIEFYAIDKRLYKKQPDAEANWERYLALRLNDELVGQRYLRTVLMHMKFELSCGLAMLLHAGGLVWLQCIRPDYFSRVSVWVPVAFLSVLAAYLLWEAFQSANVTARTRRILIDALRQNPDQDSRKPM